MEQIQVLPALLSIQFGAVIQIAQEINKLSLATHSWLPEAPLTTQDAILRIMDWVR
ncbi:MAG: hypothetical protein HPY59_05715 [Anaerolineae bacterium]|nr:hypothetical protein [Anaerolineae bacterium]